MSINAIGTSSLLKVWAYGETVPVPGDSRFEAGYIAGERPPASEHNHLWKESALKTNHILQRGVPLWGSDKTYSAGDVVNHSGRLYQALATNTNSAPSLTNTNWLAYATYAEVRSAAPPGEIAGFNMISAPTGWLKCNGAAIPVASYPDLTNAIFCGAGANATAEHSYRCTDSGNPSSTRNVTGSFIVLPDYRGIFGRGWDDGRGIDTARNATNGFYTSQLDAFQGHHHAYFIAEVPRGTATPAQNVDNVSANAFAQNFADSNPTNRRIRQPIADGSNGTPRTAAETRPRNLAELICIKF